MPNKQQCKQCRNMFNSNDKELNYDNFKEYGFKSKEAFRKHNSKNKNCPCKKINSNKIKHSSDSYSPIPNWNSYIQSKDLISDMDYSDDQEIMKHRKNKHNRGGRKLWYKESEEAATLIIMVLLNPIIQWITLVAEPGSGKTMVAHNLIYSIFMLPYDKLIPSSNITITTGMSDTEWYDQIIHNFKLRGDDYLWNDINQIDNNHCITHRSKFHKRVEYLLLNTKFLSNHIFIIDESHFADDKDMTIDTQFTKLGLTEERMKEYNIKIIFISATPDVNLSLMTRKDNHKLIQLKNGEGYKGFEYHYDSGRIIDDDNIDLGKYILLKYRQPRYHYIRARTSQEKGKFREEIEKICQENDWVMIEDDSDNNYYLSFEDNEQEKNAKRCGKTVIQTYNQPNKHTVISIKNKYQASKRLKLTKYTGVILEKKSKKRNTTVTSNGLIPRFFGYNDWPTFDNKEDPVFICDKISVEEYIKFSKNFIYDGKDYSGSKIKSDENKIKELRNTCYGSLANIIPKTRDKRIHISEAMDKDTDIQKYLLMDRGFKKANIEVKSKCKGNKGNDGYMYPKRNVPGHINNKPDNTFLTEDIYKSRFVNNGGGSFINQCPEDGGQGQSFMIYPVYKNSESGPNDFKYYVHSLDLN